MLTGDGQRTALAVSSRLGIERFVADALPDDKAEFVRELQMQGKKVAMVGDGINDSQALALADVSIAMGKGTDIAMDVAMVTLMTSDLLLLPKAFTDSSESFLGVYLQPDRYSYCCRYLVPAEWFVIESDAGKCRNGVLQCERSAQFVELGKKMRNEL